MAEEGPDMVRPGTQAFSKSTIQVYRAALYTDCFSWQWGRLVDKSTGVARVTYTHRWHTVGHSTMS